MMLTILFWLFVAIIVWLGLRNLITIIVGTSHEGPLRPGQRACHAISLLLYWAAAIVAILLRAWWPLLAGWLLEIAFRYLVIWSGRAVRD